MTQNIEQNGPGRWPDWVPDAARHYLAHTDHGQPIRALARAAKVHASTILRQVRRFEGLRDDPLIDDALRDLSRAFGQTPQIQHKDDRMSAVSRPKGVIGAVPTEDQIEAEGLRILRRLTEPGAVLAVARDMDMGIVLRDSNDGSAARTAVVERTIAQAMALKDWIACLDPTARVVRYHLTAYGRTELRRMMAAAYPERTGFAETQALFRSPGDGGDERIRHMRSVLGDSPLAALARRHDKDGQPFLARDLVQAGERLREDFELSQAGARVTMDWDKFLTTRSAATGQGGGLDRGASAARDRVEKALADLGPELGEVALRCCCYLEGLETLEKRKGWSARSAKIVLRIALQRLLRHYAETQGKFAPMIG